MAGLYLSTSLKGDRELMAALMAVPAKIEKQLMKKAVTEATKTVLSAQKATIPARKTRRIGVGRKKGTVLRKSIDEFGQQQHRESGYMRKALRAFVAMGNRKGSFAKFTLLDTNKAPLLITHSKKSFDRGNAMDGGGRITGRYFDRKTWKVKTVKAHLYGQGRRRYFYPFAVEFGWTRWASGKKVPGKNPIRRGADNVGQRTLDKMSSQISDGIVAAFREGAK